MSIFQIAIVISSIFIFASCGGGTPPVEQEPMKNLFLIDSPINGVDYECGVRKDKSKSQIVDGVEREGVVNCRKGSVTFKIGNLIIGKLEKYKDFQEVYLQDLINISKDSFDNTELLKLGMFVQSIDDDGDINQTINITDEIKNKINIKSLDDMNISDVKDYLIKLGKTPRDTSDVREHIIENSGIPYIQDLNITISDDSSVGTIIASLDITNSDNLSDIEIIKGEDIDYFYISKVEKTIQLNKEVDYKNKYLYNYQIQATNSKGKSNIAMINIHITTEDIENMQYLNKAGIGDNIIYTKDDSYEITIEAKEGVKVYLDGYDTYQVVDETGKITIKEDILNSNTREEHNIILGYENGTKSEPKLFVIVKDTISPIITTPNNLSVEENVKIVTNIDVEDINKDYGLEYSILGIDSQYLNISEIGEVSFKNRPDYEVPLDEDSNNIYEIEVKVSDKSGNEATKNFEIQVIDVLDFLPIIYEFITDISISESVGNIIGQITFESPSSDITNISLTGEGANNFQLNNNGSLTLIQNLTQSNSFKLMVNITNRYGTTSQGITINVIDSGRLGIAQLGRLSNAIVKIIKINSDNTEELIDEDITSSSGDLNQIGNFDLKVELLEDNSFYIYEVTSGLDVDINNDNIEDDLPTSNNGVIRLVVKGIWVKNATKTIRVTALSEMLYLYAVAYIKNNYIELEAKLNEISKILLREDLDNDFSINARDIMVFNPINDQDKLYITLRNNKYQSVADNIRSNGRNYIKTIFDTKALRRFTGNFEVMGDFIYNFEQSHLNIYSIYDNTLVNKLYIDQDDSEILDHDPLVLMGEGQLKEKIYFDSKNNIIFNYVSKYEGSIVAIDISNIKQLKITSEFLIKDKLNIEYYKNNIFYFRKWGTMSLDIIDYRDIYNPIEQELQLPRFKYILNNKGFLYSFDNQDANISNIYIDIYNLSDIYNVYKENRYYIPHEVTTKAYLKFDDGGYIYLNDNKKKETYNIYKYQEQNEKIYLDLVNPPSVVSSDLRYGLIPINEFIKGIGILMDEKSYQLSLKYLEHEKYTPMELLFATIPLQYSIDKESIKDKTIFDRF